MQTAPIDQLVGKTLGDYEVERLLGRGKLSAVYMARQRSQNHAVMITIFLLPELLSTQARERFNTRFYQIGASILRLNHPHILRSEEHTSELQSHLNLVCRLLLEKKKISG